MHVGSGGSDVPAGRKFATSASASSLCVGRADEAAAPPPLHREELEL